MSKDVAHCPVSGKHEHDYGESSVTPGVLRPATLAGRGFFVRHVLTSAQTKVPFFGVQGGKA